MTLSAAKTFTDPLIDDNPVTVNVLGICSVLAVTTKLETALVMCVALTAVAANRRSELARAERGIGAVSDVGKATSLPSI